MPPRTWLAAVFALITLPMWNTPAHRDTRVSPVSASTFTSRNCTPEAALINRWAPSRKRGTFARRSISSWLSPPVLRAMDLSVCFSSSHACITLGAVLAVWTAEAAAGPNGSSEPPYSTRMASNGTPSASAVICAWAVAAPMPVSWKAQRTRTLPSAGR
jgi:hypothetical protein